MAESGVRSALSVASRRLRERKESVLEQLKFAESRVKDLQARINEKFDEDCNQIEHAVNSVITALENKRGDMIRQVEAEKDQKLKEISSCMESINACAAQIQQDVCNATKLEEETNQSKFFTEYSSVINSLEDRYIELLLLLDDGEMSVGHDDKSTIDLSEVIDLLESLTVQNHDGSQFTRTQCGEDQFASAECSMLDKTSLVPASKESGEKLTDVINRERSSCDDVTKDDIESVKIGSTNDDTCNLSCSEELCRIEDLKLSPGMSLEVYVTEVSDPYNFIVQPVKTELISMMEDMGDHYSNEEYSMLSYRPKLGEFCCAQFSEDECWYRAEIIQYEEDSEVKVCYIDYGNQEKVSCCHLRPLASKFCCLPRQAINCSLNALAPFHCNPGLPSNVWNEQICEWFSNLLLGKSIKIRVTNCMKSNQVTAELFLQFEEVQDSVYNFLKDAVISSDNLVPLSKFMCSFGLSNSPTQSPSSISCTDEEDVKPKCSAYLPPVDFTKLPPLLVRLDSSLAFTCLISHINSNLLFYVHPIQRDLAHAMNHICDTLNDYYAVEDNCVVIPPEDLKCGSVCAVISVEYKQWCRGVISCIQSDMQSGMKVKFLIFFLDYGGSEWMESSNLFSLMTSLREYPAQVMCCSFSEVTAKNCSCEEVESTCQDNPDIVGNMEKSYVCSVIGQEYISECISYLEAVTCETKQLVASAKVKVKSKDALFMSRVECVLPVDLYDTTEEIDAHINENLVDILWKTYGNNLETDEKGLESCNLDMWNPMEDDFLSKRNIYKIDDEDAGLALEGYKSTNRICRFFNSKNGCFSGDSCPFLHLHNGMQVENATIEDCSVIPLPRRNSWIVVIVTAIVSPTRFYVQLPLGCKSPLSMDTEPDKGMDFEEDFYELVKDMTAYYDQQVFSERDVILPHSGEIIAARYFQDGCWYRARVIDSMNDTLLVFFVDYGNTCSVVDTDIRSIKPEYLLPPFQAVECYLPNLTISDSYISNDHGARECFTGYIQNKVLMAKVITVEANGSLGLELYSASEDGTTDTDINRTLIDCGLLRVHYMKPVIHADTSTIIYPG